MIRPIPLRLAIAAAFALHASAAVAQPDPSPAAPVVLDGVFGEWEGVTPVVVDPADAPAPYADVRAVRVRHDAAGIYLSMEFEREVALQALPSPLVLLLDWTGAETGWEAHGMRGIDAAIEFSPAGGPGGIGVRMMDSAGRTIRLVTANVAGVIAAPTHAARRFEVRIGGGPVPIDRRMTARLVALDRDGRMADETTAFVIDPGVPIPRPTPPGAGTADPLARAPGTELRVVSWNVGREDLFQQPEAFGAILRALAPDLLMLDEVAGGHSAEEVEALLDRILPGDRPWRVLYGASGGSQRGVIATRGAQPLIVTPFHQLFPYPDSALDLVPADAPQGQHDWLRSRLDAGIAATGVVVRIEGRPLFAVTVDLESGGAPGSARDRLRRIEALALRAETRATIFAAERGELEGVLITGDLNLVGSRAPLDILAAPVGDGPPFTVAHPLRLDGASSTTWENAEEPFTPGRLDFVLIHPAFLAVSGGFVFSSADLSPEWRERHGLQAETSRVTDHLPIVTDLRWVER